MHARHRRGWTMLTLAVALVAAACAQQPPSESTGAGASPGGAPAQRTLRLYTTVTEDTVEAVVSGYTDANPEVDVELFRAPTGELNARIAAEQREGGIRADVLWLTDPVSMHAYDVEGLLRPIEPAEADAVPAEYRTEVSVGTRILDMAVIHGADVEPPATWKDLTDPAYADGVALPDPAFAGSALGVLGYFALDDDYGLDYYRALKDNGAVTVPAPDEVVTGVAEGRYSAGMTLGTSARAAIEQGSPIELVRPEPGAIAVYSPIGAVDGEGDTEAADAFVDFVLRRPAQQAIAETGWQPIRDDIEWPHEGPQVVPDWPAVLERQADLLSEYQAIFGG
ncbi:MAG: extracellular solute-binding protein [Egibacteraceae bacterium]